MTPTILPLSLYREGERRYPGIYSTLARLEDSNGSAGISWPDYCLLPIEATLTALVSQYHAPILEAATYAAQLTALYCWDRHRIIYHYDATLAETLAAQAGDMTETDVLPAELLLRLPYPCIYLSIPGLNAELDGVLVWIEHDSRRNAPELRTLYCYRDGSTERGVLHLLPGRTIGDCIADTNAEIARNVGEDVCQIGGTDTAYIQRLLTVIQMVLYLVSERADVELRTPPRPKRHAHGKRGGKRPPQERPVVSGTVGVHIGGAIRRQLHGKSSTTGGGGTGSSKRPHTRRGHWHHYWVGAHDTPERRLILKWTPPTLIHPEDGGKDVSIYPVK